MTIDWKAVDQYFTVVQFVFRFSPVCSFRKFDNFVLGAVRNERVNKVNYPPLKELKTEVLRFGPSLLFI